RVLMIGLFGFIGIAGTYAGAPVHGAVANFRAIGAMVAGFLGGPLVGAGAGFIAGAHRYLLGGFTAFPCGLATFLEGLAAGIIQKYSRNWPVPWTLALAATAIGEALHMLLALLLARPFSATWALVQIVGPPMIIINSAGVAIFLAIVKGALEREHQTAALQAQKALQIAARTLPFLRRGLNRQSATRAAEIIYQLAGMDAVAITDARHILVHLGEGADHHIPGGAPLTRATRQALVTGMVQVANQKEEIGCRHPGCKLTAAVVVPLKSREVTLGTLKLYRKGKSGISALDLQLALGLADLFSTQLELARLEQRARLAAGAELKALQAQVNPHFLFNALNTITSLVRTRPETARELLIKLSNFFRHNLQKANQFVTLEEELAHVGSYLAIEQARFGHKLRVVTNIEPATRFCPVPSFILQPLVENAVKHGLQPKEEGGQVEIEAAIHSGKLVIVIRDDGVGIPPEEQQAVFISGYGRGSGIGLSNVNERLKNLYGTAYALDLTSRPGGGTTVTIRVPLEGGANDVRDLVV
ncbi:MAG: sensor histidine kinase, partial [Bacillota bacterium]